MLVDSTSARFLNYADLCLLFIVHVLFIPFFLFKSFVCIYIHERFGLPHLRLAIFKNNFELIYSLERS